jgi:hypothetical protein
LFCFVLFLKRFETRQQLTEPQAARERRSYMPVNDPEN